jgi:AcrR family transcriptional regulator
MRQMRADGASGREDPRITRSRQALTEAAHELLMERNPEKISVTDIAQRAGLSRPTLYQHFADRESVLAAAVQMRLAAILGLKPPKGSCASNAAGPDRLYALIDELDKSRERYRLLIDSSAGSRVRREIAGYFAVLVSDYITRGRPANPSEAEYLAKFVAGGAMALLENWIEYAEGRPPRTDARQFSADLWAIIVKTCNLDAQAPATG